VIDSAGRPATDELVTVHELVKRYPIRGAVRAGRRPGVYAVRGISLRIIEGEALGLVGESGCGKSTTARLLLRLEKPTAGRVLYRGRDLADLRGPALRDFRRRAQIVFQDPFGTLNPRMRVGTMLREVLEFHGPRGARSADDRMVEILAMVGLDADAALRYPHEFSGGQRQRIGIARALSVGPEFLVADEAVSALDVSVQAQVLNLLRDLQSKLGLTYLFIAHDLGVVRYLCDRVAVMYLGSIVELATAAELFAHPRHPYTRALLSAVPRVRPGKRLERIVLEGDAEPSPGIGGCPFYPRCTHPARDAACMAELPPLEETRSEHWVRCVKWKEA